MIIVNYATYEDKTGGPPPQDKMSVWRFTDVDGWEFTRADQYRAALNMARRLYCDQMKTDFGQLYVEELPNGN